MVAKCFQLKSHMKLTGSGLKITGLKFLKCGLFYAGVYCISTTDNYCLDSCFSHYTNDAENCGH